MLKTRTHDRYRYASSKRAAALGMIGLTVLILELLSTSEPISDTLFTTKRQKSRKLWEMRRLGYITKDHVVTNKGVQRLSEEKIWSLAIPRPARWDGKWRMVLFDIPAKKSRPRHLFRARLKEMGLVLYQHSVWVYPYPLEETVRAISDFYNISDCVLFAVAEKLNGGEQLARKFGVTHEIRGAR